MPSVTATKEANDQKSNRPKYYLASEVAKRNVQNDCWVHFLGKVYNLTPLLQQYPNDPLNKPLLKNAGQDLSHWFDEKSGNLKMVLDPVTNCQTYYLPEGRFLHVPPSMPRTDWSSNIECPWWLDDEKYKIGMMTKAPRKLKIINMLNQTEHILDCCDEETLLEIQERYIRQFNAHARGYTWKRLGKILNMETTLSENGIPNEHQALKQLEIDENDWLPVIHLYFSDDLTVA